MLWLIVAVMEGEWNSATMRLLIELKSWERWT